MGGYNFGDGGGWSILDMGGDRYSWGGKWSLKAMMGGCPPPSPPYWPTLQPTVAISLLFRVGGGLVIISYKAISVQSIEIELN